MIKKPVRIFWFGAILLAGASQIWGGRPPQTDDQSEIFRGVTYERRAVTSPRTLMIHSFKINLATPWIDFLVTPGDAASGMDLYASTTSAFVKKFGVQVAVNGGFFEPFRGSPPYYPLNGDPVNVKGLAISDGVTYSVDGDTYPVLCVTECDVQIKEGGCNPGTLQAIAGNAIILKDGFIIPVSTDVSPSANVVAPRTAVALDVNREFVWLIVVDGRQAGYSEGVTLAELAQIAKDLGAGTALNLDGGGSSTMVSSDGDGNPILLNSSIDRGIVMRERPVGNHLGVYAQPLMTTSD